MQSVVSYQAPALELVHAEVTAHPWVVFAVFVFIWATALWYAWYCSHIGGSPNISFSWGGFRVVCQR